jgi:hypothetical protein
VSSRPLLDLLLSHDPSLFRRIASSSALMKHAEARKTFLRLLFLFFCRTFVIKEFFFCFYSIYVVTKFGVVSVCEEMKCPSACSSSFLSSFQNFLSGPSSLVVFF